jgi:predicted dehydrogenase
MQRLRIGLVGAGLVGQAEHAYYLWDDPDRFAFIGLADASPSVRAAVGARYGLKAVHADLDGLLASGIDAVVIAAPDPYHPSMAVAALEYGVHVLCEKPLALTVEGCEKIAKARDRSGRIAQVAYMKRHDPAYKHALTYLPSTIEEVKLISVEVNDPDHEPFVAHLPMVWGADLPASLREQARLESARQLSKGAGRALDSAALRAFGNGFLSALVHDVAVVHGILAHCGCELPASADQGAIFDDGRGVQFGFALPGGGRVNMIHLNLPTVPDYTERVTVYCVDRIIELKFPSPYLRHQPTRLQVRRRGEGSGLDLTDYRLSYEEAFREQLRAFHSAATGKAPVLTTVEQGRSDIALLTSAMVKALS